MPEAVTRYSITVPPELMDAFDRRIRPRHYANRSEAIRDLLRDALVEDQVRDDDRPVMGTVTVVFDHEQRELGRRLTSLQHAAHEMVVCTTHVHLDHQHCLEVIVLRGAAGRVREVADDLIGTRGVIHGKLVCTAVGNPVPHEH
jgi:CopG family transcriptional regulator, nickel-responsive regulator